MDGDKRILKKTRHIFDEVRKARGNDAYLHYLLRLIKVEQLRRRYGKHFKPWERRFVVLPLSETSYEIMRYPGDGNAVGLDVVNAPEPLRDALKKMEEHSLAVEANPFGLDGRLTTVYKLDTAYNGERYLLKAIHTVFLESIEDRKRKGRKGKIGTPMASMVMYLLYEYFKFLDLKKVHPYIATLVNEYAPEVFVGEKDMERLRQNVRRRIQWARKRKEVMDYARMVEEKWFDVNKKRMFPLLVIDDDEDQREVLKDRLGKECRVCEAEDVSEGLEILGREDIAAVLIDVNLPIRSSIRAVSQVKRIKPEVPVVLMSPFSDPEIKEKGTKEGAYACIYKPFDLNDLLEVIREIAGRDEARERIAFLPLRS